MRVQTRSWTDEQVVELLGRVPLFRGLPETELWSMTALARPRGVGKGEMLFREGDPGDRFYIVYSGAVEVLKERPLGDHERLAVKRAGEAFGEMSLLNDAPRSASVRALEPSELLVISRDDFNALLGGSALAIGLLRSLARSLRALDIRFTAALGGEAAASDGLTQFSRVIQHTLIPKRVPEVPGFELGLAVARDDETDGRTLYDVMPSGSDGALVAVLDVKGSGLPPGHLLGLTRALLRQLADGPVEDVGRLMTELNEALADNLFAGLDECVNAALLRLTPNDAPWLCVAGQHTACVVRGDGELEELKSQGAALGILPGFAYEARKVELGVDDLLLVTSEIDGALRRGVHALAIDRREEPVAQLGQHLQNTIVRARGMRDPGQDVALLVARRLKHDSRREATIWRLGAE
ncbi:MAG TPA: cyclic nucleotide-binding domain-containing protein [Longimicrobiales bacterium]|nr:cyclic nucleotide-binding domain-containing protein [Longimicrobiales bacterium]